MDYEAALKRLLETRREGGLPTDSVLDEDEVEERYIELVEGDLEGGAGTIRVVRAWCGAFESGELLQEHAITPDGTLVRIRQTSV